MTRRVRRAKEFEVTLSVHDEGFIRPPRDSQRNWLLNRAMKEFADELVHLNEQADRFVAGQVADLADRTQAELDDAHIMEDWQIPVMERMAKLVCENHGDILEIGFGRGVGSDFIQREGVRSHTIIECNDTIAKRFERWRSKYPTQDIRLVHGLWQDTIESLGSFDGIFFHTYPLNEEEFVEQVVQCSTFAEHFFTTAALHLNPGGLFSYLTNEADSLSRSHQRALLRHFSSFAISVITDLEVPEDTRDAMWANSMVMVQVCK